LGIKVVQAWGSLIDHFDNFLLNATSIVSRSQRGDLIRSKAGPHEETARTVGDESREWLFRFTGIIRQSSLQVSQDVFSVVLLDAYFEARIPNFGKIMTACEADVKREISRLALEQFLKLSYDGICARLEMIANTVFDALVDGVNEDPHWTIVEDVKDRVTEKFAQLQLSLFIRCPEVTITITPLLKGFFQSRLFFQELIDKSAKKAKGGSAEVIHVVGTAAVEEEREYQGFISLFRLP
jgi:hypothetical protein